MLNTPHKEQPGGIQLFTHPSFGTIRTAGDAENPLFCLKDVCKALGLQSGHVIERLDKGSVSTHPLQTRGGVQQANFINEDGLYDVIFDSRKPEAKAFRKWVTSVVLPTIRKTGHYGANSTTPTPVSLDEFKKSLVATMQELVIKTVSEALMTYMPAPTKESSLVEVKQPTGSYSLKQIAKELDTHSCRLVDALVSIHMLTRHHSKVVPTRRVLNPQKYFLNLPYSQYYTDFIVVTEFGRQAILDAFPTYKKQHPYL